MEELAEFSRALGDINRLKIVALVQREIELCVCEISDTLSIVQPLVSRYLKQLKKAHILGSRKDGKWMIYFMNPNPSDILKAYLDELKRFEYDLGKIIKCSKK